LPHDLSNTARKGSGQVDAEVDSLPAAVGDWFLEALDRSASASLDNSLGSDIAEVSGEFDVNKATVPGLRQKQRQTLFRAADAPPPRNHRKSDVATDVFGQRRGAWPPPEAHGAAETAIPNLLNHARQAGHQ